MPDIRPDSWLRALGRYFFVKAPSRAESARQAQDATLRLSAAVGRLSKELALLDAALRPENTPPKRPHM